MNVNNTEGFIDVYARSILNEIKSIVERTKVSLKNPKETDRIMLEEIKKIYGKNGNSQFDASTQKKEEDNIKLKSLLAIYYAAIDNDNLQLLKKLQERRYSFFDNYHYLELFALDNKLSSKFDEDEYVNLLLNKKEVFRTFINSLNKNVMDENECINEFAKILKANPNIADYNNEDIRRCSESKMLNILTASNIAHFGSKFILETTYEQRKNILNRLHFNYEDNEKYERIKKLITNPSFNLLSFDLYTVMGPNSLLNNFTDEEIIKLCQSDVYWLRDYYDSEKHEYDYEAIKNVINGQTPKKATKKDGPIRKLIKSIMSK